MDVLLVGAELEENLALRYIADYAILDVLPLEPEAFRGLTSLEDEPAGMSSPRASELLYFSYVTLTTLGYGDITPISATARTFSYLQAVFGQFYIAILIAGLVGAYIAKYLTSPD